MKRRTLTCYLVSEILPPFMLGLLTFTFILLIARILKLVELIVTRGIPLTQVGRLLVLILPTFLELTLPMAFLLAILLGLGRLSGDQELLALKSSGVSPVQILLPLIFVAASVAIITFLLTTWVRPAAQVALKDELYNIAKTRVATALREKVFNDDFPNILIYVEEIIPPGNVGQGILIIDKRETARDNIIVGKVGLINTEEQTHTLSLRLFDGSIYERDRTRSDFSQTNFNIYDFKLDLDEFIGPAKMKDAGPKEMSLNRLLKTIEEKQAAGINARPELMEFHQRIAFSFAPIVFCLLGVSLSLLPRTSRANRSWGVALCVVWLVVYYALLSLGKALGERGAFHPFVALWFPNIIIGVISLHLFRKALYESPLLLQTRFDAASLWLGQRLTRFENR
ncbi:MAG TPA: LPS export ABC transporter permease LptF [Candidatus Binatia bacterium]|nr:LPS export ABC transporter permease LptF [Candidatus Binatia bacterium]